MLIKAFVCTDDEDDDEFKRMNANGWNYIFILVTWCTSP